MLAWSRSQARPSRKGKKASEATTEFCSDRPAFCALIEAMRAESMRLIWPAPTPTVMPLAQKTMALLFTYWATVQANIRSSNCWALGCKVGLTIKPGTEPQALAPYLDQLDLVLVMSVEPGFGGQSFMPETMPKLRALAEEARRRGSRVWLQVDGGISERTIEIASSEGADTFVAGSAVYGADDIEAAVTRLRDLARAASLEA